MVRLFPGLLAALSLAPVVAGGKPHVLLVLADDYGWANLGVHRRNTGDSPEEKQGRAETHTPRMDALIDDGILLDRHYAYKICSPSRSALQTGRLAVHVNPVNTGVTAQNYDDPVSGFAGIPRNMTGLAQKLREGGYRTHMVGKWDVGMATPDHSPKGRGYETWIGYYQHANDYWRKNTVFFATGEVDSCLNSMVDFSMHNATYCGPVLEASSLSDACRDSPEEDPACFEEHVFKERALEIVREHDVTKADEPLFLFYSFHLLHTPLQVPNFWLAEIDRRVAKAGGRPFGTSNRRLYAAMALYMDAAIGEVVDALKAKGMYENTLIVFMSDNGGPVYEPGAANNHPLQGSKYSDWDGGHRVNAFVSGGFVPKERRGTVFDGIVNIADWYGTILDIAGLDSEDYRAAKANEWLRQKGLPLLPPVDSVPQWGFILNGTNGRPGAMHMSEKAVLQWPYKLVTGRQFYSTWTGPVFPNCSTVTSLVNHEGPLPASQDVKIFGEPLPVVTSQEEESKQMWMRDCGEGCLVNVEEDPTEHVDLARDPAHADILKSLQATLKRLNQDLFNPDRGVGRLRGCEVALENQRTFGPFVDTEGFYSPMPNRTREQELQDTLLSAALKIVNSDIVRPVVIEVAQYLGPTFFSNFKTDTCLKGEEAGWASQGEALPAATVAFV